MSTENLTAPEPVAPSKEQAAAARRALFANANFRWLLGGGLLSMLGDQFTLIAMPWLVLQLSQDPLVLGTVLALGSLPRALFILVGGAIVDRYSSKAVLMLTKLVNGALLATLAALVWTGTVSLPLVYAISLAIGLATAFSYPAGSSILPQVLPKDGLQMANGVLMGMRQLSVLLGPVLAGLLIAGLGADPALREAAAGADRHGLALAFGFDALSFLISSWTLAQVRLLASEPGDEARQPVLQSIAEAMRWCWRDVELRTLCLYFAAVSFFVVGPIQVALPVLAKTQLPDGAAALGLMFTVHGLGSLVGMGIAGAKPHWRLSSLGATILLIDTIAALVFMPFGHIHASWQGAALLLPLGALAGTVQVAVFSWMQRRVPAAMMGRAMSLFMFIFMGLAPLASAAAGAALRVLSPADLFTASGLALLLIVAFGAVMTPIRRIAFA
ncbi:MFS transporter [Paucibacter sp. APW11]|uniref:MFS transporter n=1 Tax=Roseateles aquae TaxID=3077235 RepID=A0ABU3PE28_9BURK|nr:MFS transporter [Paucibacter sp. APW11]MDT9000835.1 MFS transporter [Paucibacter sp. APW11]